MQRDPPPELYQRFRENTAIEPASYFWIGRVADKMVVPFWVSNPPNPPDPAQLLPRRSVSRTWRFGEVLFKYARVPQGTSPDIIRHPWLQTFMQPLYPTAAPLLWLPPWALDQPMVGLVHDIMRVAPPGRRMTQAPTGSWRGCCARRVANP